MNANLGIADADRLAIADGISGLLADTYTLYLKTHKYHWNVTGPGNVVGSNIFNLLGVLGASAALSSSGIPVDRELIRLDYPVMLAATLVLIPICWNGFAIKRWEGVLLAAFYVAYVAFLVMDAGDSTAPELFRTMMLIVIPIVFIAFTATGIQGWRKYRATQSA